MTNEIETLRKICKDLKINVRYCGFTPPLAGMYYDPFKDEGVNKPPVIGITNNLSPGAQIRVLQKGIMCALDGLAEEVLYLQDEENCPGNVLVNNLEIECNLSQSTKHSSCNLVPVVKDQAHKDPSSGYSPNDKD